LVAAWQRLRRCLRAFVAPVTGADGAGENL
jgi:hypothetical protein